MYTMYYIHRQLRQLYVALTVCRVGTIHNARGAVGLESWTRVWGGSGVGATGSATWVVVLVISYIPIYIYDTRRLGQDDCSSYCGSEIRNVDLY